MNEKKKRERPLTPPQIAERLGVGVNKVLCWIRSGELTAINLTVNPKGERPRYRIQPSDLESFLLKRRTVPKPKVNRRRRKQSGVIEYF